MRQAATQVPVLIVGGGPVGLTARVLLERWDVPSLLVEKRRELSPFPRSRLVNVRSMEIFRQLGLETTIAAGAFAPTFGRIRFRDTLLGSDFATQPMVGIHDPVPESPVTGVVTSQDRLEPVLLGAADAEARFGVELVDLASAADHAVASLVDHRTGVLSRVHARYVIAADGADSAVRRRLGIDTAGPGAMANVTTVVFDTDLRRWSAEQPAGVYFTSRGTFLPLYPEGGWAWFAPTPPDPGHADWPGLLRHAIGPGADLRVEVRRVQHWTMTAQVAERFRADRVLLAGDAAHAVPIIGGLGMNVGLADVHNLCWKLAGVLHGWAGPGLLASYQPERLPVAQRTLEQTVANTQLMMRVQAQRLAQRSSAPLELPWSERYFAQHGLVLGCAYESGAVIGDGTAAPAGADPVTDYVPTARPGHRLPHGWLGDGRCTLDTLGEWFTLLTPDADAWRRQTPARSPLHVEPLSDELAKLCDVGPHGAVLVRPDGHVGARWPDGPPGGTTLRDALAALCGEANIDVRFNVEFRGPEVADADR